MDHGQDPVAGLPAPPGAGTFPRCPGIPGSVEPPAGSQSIGLHRKENHQRFAGTECFVTADKTHPAVESTTRQGPLHGGQFNGGGIKVPWNCLLEDLRGSPGLELGALSTHFPILLSIPHSRTSLFEVRFRCSSLCLIKSSSPRKWRVICPTLGSTHSL